MTNNTSIIIGTMTNNILFALHANNILFIIMTNYVFFFCIDHCCMHITKFEYTYYVYTDVLMYRICQTIIYFLYFIKNTYMTKLCSPELLFIIYSQYIISLIALDI
jgi:hypothetical protein